MTAAPRFDAEDLLRHDAFVRELARRLVYDAHGAEDIAQQTWVAALAAPVRPLDSLRSWLGAIVRHTAGKRARSERTRRLHLEAAARPDVVPSAADIFEREHARAAVVREVLALPEAYRSVVLLRWFEGLTPRAVAQRLQVPVETVRTRHRRAMELLRTRLDAHAGGNRAAWCTSLLPLVNGSRLAAVGGVGIFGGLLLMSTKLKLMSMTAALGGLLCWLLWSPAEAPPGGVARGANEAPAVAQGAFDVRAAAAAAAPAAHGLASDRNEVTPALAETGSVLARLVWAEDGMPAADVTVTLYRGGSEASQRSDRRGIARLLGLAPGVHSVALLRPDQLYGTYQNSVDVVAGREQVLELQVPSGLDLRGIVVDGDDRPIADAEILVGLGNATVMARTGEHGTFAVRDVEPHCDVSARAAGRAPSQVRSLSGSVGGAIDLRFVLAEPGAQLDGVVFAPDGQPVAGARVRLGERNQTVIPLPDGTHGYAHAPAREVTGSDGRFSFSALPVGTLPIAVDTPQLAPWRSEVRLRAGVRDQLVVHLLTGVTVQGVVKNGAGEPVADAEVIAGTVGALRDTRTASDGSYTLVGALAGEVPLSVRSARWGELREVQQAAPGETLRWDAILSGSTTQRGRVLGSDKSAIAGVRIEAWRIVGRETPWNATVWSDAEGRFELGGCKAGEPMRLDCSRGPFVELRLEGVVPSAEELAVTMPAAPSARIRGVLLDEHGAALPNAEISPLRRGQGNNPVEGNDAGTGAFELGPYPAGDYMLVIRVSGFAPLRVPYHTVAAGEVWDAGELVMERGGSVRVVLHGEPLQAPERSLWILDPSGTHAKRLEMQEGAARAGPLVTGEHLLQVFGDDVACEIVPFVIRTGAETQLQVTFRRGTVVTLQFAVAASSALPGDLRVVLTTADGTPVLHSRAGHEVAGSLQLQTTLRPGRYRVHAQTAAQVVPAWSGEGEFEVGAEALVHRVELAPR